MADLMTFSFVTAIAFTSGMICSELKSWKLWLPATAVAGLTVGLLGRYFGMTS